MEAADDLREQIEAVRGELNELAALHGIQGVQVIEKSKELDRLLNAYQSLGPKDTE